MESFIGSILNEWHFFENQYINKSIFTLFRNIFIVYNSNQNQTFAQLKSEYDLDMNTNVFLYNDAEKATKQNFTYLHKHNISRKRIDSIIELMNNRNATYSYEAAIAFLEEVINVNNEIS